MQFIKRLIIMSGQKAKGTLSLEKNAFGVSARLNVYGANIGDGRLCFCIDKKNFVFGISEARAGLKLGVGMDKMDNIHAAVFDGGSLIMYGTNEATRLCETQIYKMLPPKIIKVVKDDDMERSDDKVGGRKDDDKGVVFSKREDRLVTGVIGVDTGKNIDGANGVSNAAPDRPNSANSINNTSANAVNNIVRVNESENIVGAGVPDRPNIGNSQNTITTNTITPNRPNIISNQNPLTKYIDDAIADSNYFEIEKNAGMKNGYDTSPSQMSMQHVMGIANSVPLNAINTNTGNNPIGISEGGNIVGAVAPDRPCVGENSTNANANTTNTINTTTNVRTHSSEENIIQSPFIPHKIDNSIMSETTNGRQSAALTGQPPLTSTNQSTRHVADSGRAGTPAPTSQTSQNTTDLGRSGTPAPTNQPSFTPTNQSPFTHTNQSSSFTPIAQSSPAIPPKDTAPINKVAAIHTHTQTTDTPRINARESSFFETLGDEIEALFDGTHQREEALEKMLPKSRWVRINFDNTRYYVVGLIGQEFLCYGILDTYSQIPPKELDGHCWWLPLKASEPLGKGYWIMYQDLKTGEVVLPPV